MIERQIAHLSRRFSSVALMVLCAFVGAALVSCGDDSGEGAEAPETTPTERVEATAPPDASPSPEPTADPAPEPTPAVTPSPPEPPTLDDPTTCSNDDAGYTVDYPGSWSTNDGAVVPPCSLFDPEPFDVPEATDERVAAISIFRENIAFSDLPVEPGTERSRTVVDGLQAVRVEGTYDGRGLYSAGTRFTSYRIDLSAGADDGPGTLLADVVDVGDIDYAEAQKTLDLMIRTLEV